ncbi:hypothetical protein DL762_007697 [Monosporascus cannonballus]|uniref:Cep57 centrosome microtubule-binding domain-containing protein n=1 Tax=Monosporascus cannonballus TaxID=155416 RepID=A0ABY0H2L3_9PEZI|nr:hypothetical protein DL762_007697 [Monosporascus cannonballus]
MTSNISLGPEGESTRRFEDESLRLPVQASRKEPKPTEHMAYNINTSVLGRTFPEWKGFNNKNNNNNNGPEQEPTEDIYGTTSDNIAYNSAKENIPPTSSTLASPTEIKATRSTKASTQKPQGHSAPKPGYKGPYLQRRSRMQARVEDETERSSVYARTPGRDQDEQVPQPHSSPSPNAANRSKPRRGNVTTLLETLKTAQSQKAEAADPPIEEPSPQEPPPDRRAPVPVANAAMARMSRRPQASQMSPSTPNHTARSFFLPNLTHMNDFLSGTLKLSSMRNGMPIFVKHGKVHDRDSKVSPDHHAEVEAISVPEDEEKIFVSLDKIREEIQALKEHDDLVTKQAEQLQVEVAELQVQIAKYKSRKDSAMGSDSESSVIDHLNAQKSQLEDQVASLQSRLDKANRKISINEIHTESYITERDEALKSATEHLEKIKRLQSELKVAREELETLQGGNTRDTRDLELEIKSLRSDNNALRAQHKSLSEENQSLRSHNESISQQQSRLHQELKEARDQLRSTQEDFDTLNREYQAVLQENAVLKQDNLSLERHNDKFFNDNKALQQKNSLLERRMHDLQDDNAKLNELLDAANAATGTMTVDAKDMKNRLESQNRRLSAENAELQQHIIDLKSDFASKRMVHDQEKRQLAAANDHLNQQIEQISKKFERFVQENKVQAATYEKQSSMPGHLRGMPVREPALSDQLKDSADHETTLQHELQRKTQAVVEVRQLSKEIMNLVNSAKAKNAKTARVVEPMNTKGRQLGETSARSITSQTDMPIQEDFTRQIDLTQGSAFASNFAQSEISELRGALRQAHAETQQQDITEESMASDANATEDASQSLPPPFIPKTRSEDAPNQRTASLMSKAQSGSTKLQPLGILKNAESSKTTRNKAVKNARWGGEEDLTGRFSVKSGLSELSLPTRTSQADFVRPRHNSDGTRLDLDANEERNMTSALFIDDITLETEKHAGKKQATKPIPSLSKDAKRVLDSLCHDHDCRNCIVCARVISHRHEDDAATKNGPSRKRSVRVDRPVAVSDRIPNQPNADYEDQPTLRPARDPAVALAVVIKGLRDEEAHLEAALARAQVQYNALDASVGRRQRRQLSAEMHRLMKQRDVKRDQLYDLHDVLEGQKAKGQEMTAEEVEVTIMSVLSRDETWNGIVD